MMLKNTNNLKSRAFIELAPLRSNTWIYGSLILDLIKAVTT
jgi:hypothetical protein